MGDHGLLEEILHMPAISMTHMSSSQHFSTAAIYQSNFALYAQEHLDFPELIAHQCKYICVLLGKLSVDKKVKS